MPRELNRQAHMVLREALTGLYWDVKDIRLVARTRAQSSDVLSLE